VWSACTNCTWQQLLASMLVRSCQQQITAACAHLHWPCRWLCQSLHWLLCQSWSQAPAGNTYTGSHPALPAVTSETTHCQRWQRSHCKRKSLALSTTWLPVEYGGHPCRCCYDGTVADAACTGSLYTPGFGSMLAIRLFAHVITRQQSPGHQSQCCRLTQVRHRVSQTGTPPEHAGGLRQQQQQQQQ
jgi:hypothetical protein